MWELRNNWKLISIFTIAGFVLANIPWILGIIPNEFSVFGFTFPIAVTERSNMKNLCDYYGFEISEPFGGYTLENGQALIEGTVTKQPPYRSVWLIAIANGNPIIYWPQPAITVDPTTKKWSGVIYASGDVTAAVVMLGENGHILFDYFRNVADMAFSQSVSYPGLTQLPKDVQTCKTASVRQR